MDLSKVKMLAIDATPDEIEAAVEDVAENKVTYLLSRERNGFVAAVLVPYDENIEPVLNSEQKG